MTQVTRDAGLSREGLYKALSGDRAPSFDTILKVIGALGLKLHGCKALPIITWKPLGTLGKPYRCFRVLNQEAIFDDKA